MRRKKISLSVFVLGSIALVTLVLGLSMGSVVGDLRSLASPGSITGADCVDSAGVHHITGECYGKLLWCDNGKPSARITQCTNPAYQGLPSCIEDNYTRVNDKLRCCTDILNNRNYTYLDHPVGSDCGTSVSPTIIPSIVTPTSGLSQKATEMYEKLKNEVILGVNTPLNKISDFDKPFKDSPEEKRVADFAPGLTELLSKASLVDFFISPREFDINDPTKETYYIFRRMKEVESEGKLVMITINHDEEFNKLQNIQKSIPYIHSLAENLAQLKHPIIRPWTEMNGEWYGYYKGISSDQEKVNSFKNAMQIFTQIFHEKAPNILIVFNPNNSFGHKPPSWFFQQGIYDGTCYDSYIKENATSFIEPKDKHPHPYQELFQYDLNEIESIRGANMWGWCETSNIYFASNDISLNTDITIAHQAHLITLFIWPGDQADHNWGEIAVTQLPNIRNAISDGKFIDYQQLLSLDNPEDRQLVLLRILLGGEAYSNYLHRNAQYPL